MTYLGLLSLYCYESYKKGQRANLEEFLILFGNADAARLTRISLRYDSTLAAFASLEFAWLVSDAPDCWRRMHLAFCVLPLTRMHHQRCTKGSIIATAVSTFSSRESLECYKFEFCSKFFLLSLEIIFPLRFKWSLKDDYISFLKNC